jgi:nitroreductase
MDALDNLKLRRSVRVYQDKAIPKEIIEKIIDVARFSPTARNVQPWEFVIVTAKETLERIGSLCDNGRFIVQAKACIAVYCSETKYYLEDGCAATQNIMLAAAGLGIGSCWVAGDKKPYCAEVSGVLNVPSSFKLVSLIALGYPHTKEELKAVEKRGLKELMHWERF